MAYHDFREYPTQSVGWLTNRLAEVVSQLAGLHQEMAMVRGTEKQAKIQGFTQSPETTVAGRERDADHMAIESTVTIFQLNGDILALQEEKALISLLLEMTHAPA